MICLVISNPFGKQKSMKGTRMLQHSETDVSDDVHAQTVLSL